MTGPVVKVGGSLFADPDLRAKLNAWLATVPGRCLIVAGGGGFADVVRDLDSVHGLGDAVAHQVAVQSLHASAALVRHLVGGRADVLDVPQFLSRFEATHGPVPAAWSLTTDSIAALVAAQLDRELVLLKSVTIPPGTTWADAAAQGWVDGEFARLVAHHQLGVRSVNLSGQKMKSDLL